MWEIKNENKIDSVLDCKADLTAHLKDIQLLPSHRRGRKR